jgi:hypothetical protein
LDQTSFKTVTASSRDIQVSAETGGTADTKSNEILSVSLEAVPLNCSNQTKQKKFF